MEKLQAVLVGGSSNRLKVLYLPVPVPGQERNFGDFSAQQKEDKREEKKK
jgi:hypothetical protein